VLIKEAKWFGQKISEMDPSNIFPMCNIGSSSDRFRKKAQPWIDEYIFRPARVKKQSVKHLDIKDAPGVDIVGDLSDRHFLKKSCPFRYPFHPDPIDTRFRPSINELARLFPGTHIYCGEIVRCETYLDYLTSSPSKLIKAVARIFIPLYQPIGWFSALMRMPWLFKNFQATCLILRKDPKRNHDKIF